MDPSSYVSDGKAPYVQFRSPLRCICPLSLPYMSLLLCPQFGWSRAFGKHLTTVLSSM